MLICSSTYILQQQKIGFIQTCLFLCNRFSSLFNGLPKFTDHFITMLRIRSSNCLQHNRLIFLHWLVVHKISFYTDCLYVKHPFFALVLYHLDCPFFLIFSSSVDIFTVFIFFLLVQQLRNCCSSVPLVSLSIFYVPTVLRTFLIYFRGSSFLKN